MTPGARLGVALSLAFTLALGLWLRWFLAGAVGLSGDFAALRHAHSHTGYYGVLFPLAWGAWRAAGAPLPSARWLWPYAVAVAAAAGGFARAGYGPEAIAASTLIGAVWLRAAWGVRPRPRRWGDALAPTAPAIVAALACIPPIATQLRSEPADAAAWVRTFLAVLLLGVLVPSAFAGRRTSLGPWPAVLAASLLAAAWLGVWPGPAGQLGLVSWAALVTVAAWRAGLDLHLRLAWTAVAAGLCALAVGLLPPNRPVTLGAIHFLILSPLLGTLTPAWLRRNPPPWAWWSGHLAVAAMSGALVAEGCGAGPWTATAAAIAGTAVVAWWTAVAWVHLRG